MVLACVCPARWVLCSKPGPGPPAPALSETGDLRFPAPSRVTSIRTLLVVGPSQFTDFESLVNFFLPIPTGLRRQAQGFRTLGKQPYPQPSSTLTGLRRGASIPARGLIPKPLREVDWCPRIPWKRCRFYYRDGHLFLESEGGLWLLDTGGSASFGTCSPLSLEGEDLQPPDSYLGLTSATLSDFVQFESVGWERTAWDVSTSSSMPSDRASTSRRQIGLATAHEVVGNTDYFCRVRRMFQTPGSSRTFTCATTS